MNEMIQLNLFDVIGELHNSSCGFTEKIQQMLNIMLNTGMSPKAISVLMAMLEISKEHLHYFNAPIISANSMWKDTLPDWLKHAIYKERFGIICSEHNQNKIGIHAGLTEAVAVLMPSSLEAPLNYEYANIYTWCGKQVSIKYNGKTESDFTGVCEMDKLPRYEQEQLNKLLADIRRKVIKNHY
jgi:hypothetical protein